MEYNFNDEQRTECVNKLVYDSQSPTNRRVFYTTFFVAGYAMPLSVIWVLYFLLLRRISGRGRSLDGATTAAAGPPAGEALVPCNGGGKVEVAMTATGVGCPVTTVTSTSSKAARARRRVMRMVTGVVVTFAACWLPIHVAMLVTSYYPPSLINQSSVQYFIAFQILATCMAYINSCLNPVIYAFVSENFRHSFGELLFGSGAAAGRRRRRWLQLQRWKPRMMRTSGEGIAMATGCGGVDAGRERPSGGSEVATAHVTSTVVGGRLTRWWSGRRTAANGAVADGVRFGGIGSVGRHNSGKSRYAFQMLEPIPATIESATMTSFHSRLVGRDPVVAGGGCGGPD